MKEGEREGERVSLDAWLYRLILPFQSSQVVGVQLTSIWGQGWNFITGSTVIELHFKLLEIIIET